MCLEPPSFFFPSLNCQSSFQLLHTFCSDRGYAVLISSSRKSSPSLASLPFFFYFFLSKVLFWYFLLFLQAWHFLDTLYWGLYRIKLCFLCLPCKDANFPPCKVPPSWGLLPFFLIRIREPSLFFLCLLCLWVCSLFPRLYYYVFFSFPPAKPFYEAFSVFFLDFFPSQKPKLIFAHSEVQFQ